MTDDTFFWLSMGTVATALFAGFVVGNVMAHAGEDADGRVFYRDNKIICVESNDGNACYGAVPTCAYRDGKDVPRGCWP